MLKNVTPAVERALATACRCARSAGAADVAPEHILMGLLSEPDGRATSLLVGAGFDPGRYATSSVGCGTEKAIDESPKAPSLSAAAERVVAEARHLAVSDVADRAVSSEQLLIALLRMDKSCRERLEDCGLNMTRLAAAIENQNEPLALDEPLVLSDHPDELGIARILDANANRTREGLRAVEDYCRFALEDATLTAEFRRLRHAVTEALAELPARLVLQARDADSDVGRDMQAVAGSERATLAGVVQANLKRAQEGLRALAEYSRHYGARTAAHFERLRHDAYTLERSVLMGRAARERLAGARLCVLVSGGGCAASLEWTIAEAAAGGADIFQLREKGLGDRELLERARRVRQATRRAGALFIMNDRPDIARLVEADGIHLGQDDMPVRQARRIVGPDALVGVSTHDVGQVRQAVLDGADYLGVGPTFASSTKSFDGLAGLEFVRQVASATSLPAFVIGGITAENVRDVALAGGKRVAVSAAVCQSDDPRSGALRLRHGLESREPSA
jgi:thiamine-phosphate pyrophosphorylase